MSKNVLHSVLNKPPVQHGGTHPHPAANTAKVSPQSPPHNGQQQKRQSPQSQTSLINKDKHAPHVQINGARETPAGKRWSVIPTTRSPHTSLTSDKKQESAAISSLGLRLLHTQSNKHYERHILPDVAPWADAPEIAHLKLMRSPPEVKEDNHSAKDVALDKGEDKSKFSFGPFKSISNCCNDCVGFFQRCFNCTPSYDELDDLEPVLARTRHSLDFIHHLARGELKKPGGGSHGSKHSASSTSHGSENPSAAVSNASTNANPNDKKLKGRAYSAIYDGLMKLNEVHHRYKQIILLLTFTRYAEDPLDEVELDLSHSRTVLGSYIWLAAYILEQAQYDNDVIYSGYPAEDVEEIVKSLERIVGQSTATWKACVKTIENVESIHENVAHVFTAIVSKFAKEEDKEIQKSRHIRVHSNYQRRAAELDNMKSEYDSRGGGGGGPGGHSTLAQFSLAPLRILYKDVNKAATESWRGFELLPQDKKFTLVKMLINDAGRIWGVVLEQLEIIAKLLKTTNTGGGGLLQPPKNSGRGGGIEDIHSFQDGVLHMQKYLEQLEAMKWSKQEIQDFLEVERIVLDNLDILTLGTATLRTLLHDGRHLVHLGYEMTREMDYLECRQMAIYADVVTSATLTLGELDGEEPFYLQKGNTRKMQNKRESIGSALSSVENVAESKPKKKKRSVFDIEERNLDMKDVEAQFDRSIYQDIIKELPVFTNNLSIGLTLQEAEAVFSESSHVMLNSLVVHL